MRTKNPKEFTAKEKLEIVFSAPVPVYSSGRQGEAGGGGGDSARRAQPVPFGYFQTDTAKIEKWNNELIYMH